MSRGGVTRSKKDVLLELVSRDIKELQRVHSGCTGTKSFTEGEEEAQLLCDHLDHILMHGLREFEDGYWPFVRNFTRNELIQRIRHLRRVTTSVGKGRSWLYTALNEQSVESYIRMFAENQDVVEEFYLRDAFIRDVEHLFLLLTLVAGLDFISFDLQVDCDYLDYGASILSSKITSLSSSSEVTPTFSSAKVSIGEGGRPRTFSDPTPNPPETITSLTRGACRGTRNEKENSAGGCLEKSREVSEEHKTNVETENRDDLRHNEGAGESIPIPSAAEESCSTMMSSSLQMTSSRNVLERMSSLEKRSPFLERAAASREGLRRRGSSRGEGVKVENGEGDDMVVAKVRRSGRSKKRRRRKNEENEESEESSSRGHVTRDGVHVTDHVTPGAVLFDPSSITKGDADKSTTPKGDVNDSIPVGEPQLTRMEECDYETEPKGGVAQEQEDRGMVMSLEMELALAAKEEPTGITSSRDAEGGHQLEQHFPPSSDPTLSKAPHNGSDNVQDTAPRGQNPFDVNEEDDDEHTPHPPSLTVTTSGSPANQQHRSYTIHHPPNEASKPRADDSQNSQQVRLGSKPSSLSSHSSSSAQYGQRAREVTPEVEGEFDIITQQEVRTLDGRTRANALYSEEREVEEGEEEERGGGGNFVTGGRRVYHVPPQRPQQATEEEKRASDIRIDETMRVVFSIDVFLPDPDRPTPPPPPSSGDGETTSQPPREKRESQGSEEEAKRCVQVSTPCGLGQYRPAYILVTTEAVYLLRRDGIEGIFSPEFGARYRDIDHLVMGLGWQSMELVYRETGAERQEELRNCVIVTGSEAVTRSLMESIQSAATQCPGFKKVIPRNRDDEDHWNAIERELIKLGSETSMDVVQYSLVSWEQVKGRPPDSSASQPPAETASGLLYFKKNSRVGLSSWKQAFFRLTDGTLHQFSSETDKLSKAVFSLTGCGGVTRVTAGETRPFVLSLALRNLSPLLLATGTEEECTQWQLALCEAMLQVQSSKQCKNPMCTVLLTKGKVHILQEDMSRGLVHHITCCEVTAVDKISVDHRLPIYCTVSYDDGEDCKGVWLLCFISEFELGKFESALAELWKEEFQIDLPFSELEDVSIIQRARHTVDLTTSTSLRSDSITKGRTEFTYSSTF